MKILLTIITSLLFYIPHSYAQINLSVILKEELWNDYKTTFSRIEVPDDVYYKINSLINKSIEASKENSDEDNILIIKKNFHKLIVELKTKKIRKVGASDVYEINIKILNQSLYKLCPLYPFC